ncbi:MAG: hypothetical protein WCT48_03750 [Candidatus Paceibacterota bacterium]
MRAFPSKMSIFHSSKPKIAVIFDIGSSSVGGAAVLLSPSQKPKMLYSVRRDMAFQENFHFERFVSSMLETLEKVAQDISAVKLPPHSEKTFSCLFASPWYASQTRILKKSFGAPVKINEDLLKETEEKEIEAFKAQEIKKMGGDAVILETKTIQTKLNGYETGNPLGKEATDFQTAIYISISPNKIVQTITEKIKKVFHAHSVHFNSFPFSSFVVLRDIFHEKSFLFMDISGEVSDISIVRDNVMQETVAFPLGKNFLIRKIASETDSSFQEALSSFHMSKNEELEDHQDKKVKKALDMAAKEWITSFQNALRSISGRKELLPRDIFITADDDVSKWFVESLQDAGASSFSVVGNVFNVRHLNGTFLSSFCDSETAVERDSFLMIESLFINRFA